jgi:hypothetical protein
MGSGGVTGALIALARRAHAEGATAQSHVQTGVRAGRVPLRFCCCDCMAIVCGRRAVPNHLICSIRSG